MGIFIFFLGVLVGDIVTFCAFAFARAASDRDDFNE